MENDNAEMISARAVCQSLGYAQWRNFDGVINRARHLIDNGEAVGVIKRTTKPVLIGSGAVRRVRDYLLDEQAMELVRALSASMKLNGFYCIRNECMILRLLKKYCRAHDISFRFQKPFGNVVFDALIAGRIAVEFDEPHHFRSGREAARDRAKDATARDQGLEMLRFTLAHDIVDVILAVETALGKSSLPRRSQERMG